MTADLAERELRIGLVGLGTGGPSTYHARSFSMIFNGPPDFELPGDWPTHLVRVPGAKVTAVWDADRQWAEQHAAAFGIEHVVDRMDDLIGLVDAVMVLDDITLTHQKRAPLFLEAGVPTFIDKPLTTDLEEARSLFRLASDRGTLLVSTSALRFSREVREARAEIERVGQPIVTVAACQGQYMGEDSVIHYGVHPLELVYSVLGPGVTSVQNIGEGQTHIVKMAHQTAGSLLLLVDPRIQQSFRLSVMGTNGDVRIAADDWDAFYANMLTAFVQSVRDGRPPVPPEETFELIAALIAARDSKRAGGVPMAVAASL